MYSWTDQITTEWNSLILVFIGRFRAKGQLISWSFRYFCQAVARPPHPWCYHRRVLIDIIHIVCVFNVDSCRRLFITTRCSTHSSTSAAALCWSQSSGWFKRRRHTLRWGMKRSLARTLMTSWPTSVHLCKSVSFVNAICFNYACFLMLLIYYLIHWATSLFGLVFRWVFSLSPKTNLTPEFWSQSEVWISWAETGAKIATKIPVLLIFVLLARYPFRYSLFAVLRFTGHCAKARTA